ncbi:prolipoprotein diacylglyceryl transferase [Cochlodiniinecator piscidefendens]|uniref:prolipoprotein diacylglyceryl transferase n=1 Tax=Cochlodiniinecator piscidefendens TaxID=2715756 RepID=UPI00140C524E|nr:prolipoprotein diacylglyceryl transferase [Cochlodiniinecator piscidefendens]
MIAMIPFPDISPELFSFDIGDFTFALRWYALAYIAGILLAWRLVGKALETPDLWRASAAPMTRAQLEDLMTWVIVGIIAGGRLGFVLFYQPEYYFANPAEILKIWTGGMSFHGGFLGVAIAGVLFCRKHNIPIIPVADIAGLAATPGLFFGRIANFINAELWGRPTDAAWGVAFPGTHAQDCADILGICARHPSQLYEAALEGLVLGLILLYVIWRKGALKIPGQSLGIFIAGYGIARFIVEFYRQADDQFITFENPMGYVIQLGDYGVSMGQLLSSPMIVVGLAIIVVARQRGKA